MISSRIFKVAVCVRWFYYPVRPPNTETNKKDSVGGVARDGRNWLMSEDWVGLQSNGPGPGVFVSVHRVFTAADEKHCHGMMLPPPDIRTRVVSGLQAVNLSGFNQTNP